MTDDPSLHDQQLEHEIRLVGDLVLAASQCEGRLPDRRIDEILGVSLLAEPAEGSAGDPDGDPEADSTGALGAGAVG